MKSDRGNGRWQPSPFTVVTVSAASALAINLATNTVHVTWRWWSLTVWISVAVLCLGALAIEKARMPSGPPGASKRGLEQATATLAREVAAQWTREAVLRQVFQPVPLQVRWSSTGRPVAASRDVVLDEPAGPDWRQLPLEGDAGEIVAAFRGLPHRQLVVLGEAGAGKSILAILLTLGLIKHPEPRQPVPVLLPIASWNPTAESAHDFIVRRLAEEYGFLGGHGADGQSMAGSLVARGLVLPILDGMDELPESMHPSAVESLDRFAAAGSALVVTCRSREYEQAVRSSGSVLSRSAVVEIEPVSVDQIIEFLSHPEPGRARWEPVFAHLRDHRDGYLAQVLSTPLMVALARISYRNPASNPAALLALSETTALAGRLIDGFVASVYQGDQPDPPALEAHWLRDYRADEAVRWIGCLAYHLYLTGTRDLWWWQLSPGLLSVRPGRTRAMMLLAAMLAAAGTGLALSLAIKPWSAFWAAATGALMIVISAARPFRSMWRTSYPPYVAQRYRSRRGRRLDYAGLRLAFGVVFGLMTGMIIKAPLLGFSGGVACGLVAVVIPEIPVPGRVRRSTPLAILRTNRRNALAAALRYGLTGGAVFAALARVIPAPATALTAGATAALVYGLAAALSAGLWTWIRFRATHLLLVAQRRLPWRPWRFFDDAHTRGVLRQAGTAWQFRHALLQDHLAREIHLSYLRRQADAGNAKAAFRLADLLAGQGRVDDAIAILRAQADKGSWWAARQLAALLAGQGRVDEAVAVWRARVEAGDKYAPVQLADLLVEQGRTDEAVAVWRARADAGDKDAVAPLVGLLTKQDRVEEAIAVLRAHADAGDWRAGFRLADLLVDQGRVEEALAILRVGAGKRRPRSYHATRYLEQVLLGRHDDIKRKNAAREAARRLADLLAAQGRADELEVRARAGDGFAVRALIRLLVSQGRVEEAQAMWRTRIGADDLDATFQLADLLVEQGRVEEALAILRTRADAGDWRAAHRLADLLASQDRVEEAIAVLRTHADAGYGDTAFRLADLLVDQGRVEEALAILRVRAGKRRSRRHRTARYLAHLLIGRGPVVRRKDRAERQAARRLANLLAAQGRVDELEVRARADDEFAVRALIGLLVTRGRMEQALAIWRARVEGGDWDSALQLADLLAGHGRVEEALAIWRARVDAGVTGAAVRLADLLVGQGRVEDAIAFWRSRVEAGDRGAAARLADLLAEQGRVEEAVAFWRGRAEAGDRDAAMRLADLLAEQGRVEEAVAILRARADARDRDAAFRLADLLARQGRIDDAVAILRARVDADDWVAAFRLADLLAGQGQVEEAVAILRPRADAGVTGAAMRLADLLVGQDRVEEAIAVMHRRVQANDWDAESPFADLLVRKGRVEEAIEFWRRRVGGNSEARSRLADLLVGQGRVEEAIEFWRGRVDTGDRAAAFQLADLLAGQDRVDEAIAVVKEIGYADDWSTVWRLASLEARQRHADVVPPG